MTSHPLRSSLSLLTAVLAVFIFSGNSSAHAAQIYTSWVPQYSACPSGYADSTIIDDTDNSDHHVGEEDTDGPRAHLCIGSDVPGASISARWATAGSCGSGGTGLYDDAGVYGSNDGQDPDLPTTHALNEENFRPDNPANAQEFCLSASGAGASLTTRWPMSAYCAVGETKLVGGKYGSNNAHGHNLNSEDHDGASQDALCAKITAATPTATLSANPLSIDAGGSSTLSWSSTNATSCSIDQGVGSVSTSGSRSVSPASGTTYTLTCSGTGGSATSQVTIAVKQAAVPPSPTGLSYSCNSAGTQVTFSWNSVSGATGYYVRHQPIGSNWIDDGLITPTSKVVSISPNQQYDWWIHANNAAGYSNQTNGARFSCAPTAPPTTIPPSPTGLKYTCAANGKSVTLSWNATPGASSYFLRMDDPTNNKPAPTCTDGWFCAQPPDAVYDFYTPTSITLSITPGRSYSWWVHSYNAAGINNSPTSGGFNCSAACVPDNSAASGVCSTTTFVNNCGQTVAGTKNCTSGTIASCTVNKTSALVGDSVIFTAHGGTPQYWYVPGTGGGLVFSSATTFTRSFSAAGAYVVSVFAAGQGAGTDCPAVTISGGVTTCTTGTPTLSIAASPIRVRTGQTSTISWTATNVLNGGSCTVSGPGVSQTIASGSTPSCSIPNGSATPTITTQSTYTITCGAATKSVTVNVVPAFQEF